jgi:hypothetical protein
MLTDKATRLPIADVDLMNLSEVIANQGTQEEECGSKRYAPPDIRNSVGVHRLSQPNLYQQVDRIPAPVRKDNPRERTPTQKAPGHTLQVCNRCQIIRRHQSDRYGNSGH